MCLDKNTVVIITGGATGVGEALVYLFLEKGCQVIIVDQKEGNSRQIVQKYGQEKCQFYLYDVEDELDVSKFFIQLMQIHTRIDFLINAAGIKKYNEDPEAQPSQRMTKYACIMMSNQKGAKIEQPYNGVIVDLAQGAEAGIEGLSLSNLCTPFFLHKIRVVNAPINLFHDVFPKQQLQDLANSIFSLTICEVNYQQFLQLSPISRPSL